MSNIHLYQIAYSPETLNQIEPGYKILNNLENPRPDWFEYWPIRKFLLNNTLNHNDYYGFFSPKFKNKTNLTYNQVYEFVSKNLDTTDIFLFSPQFDMGAFFLNIFEQGEAFDAGFLEVYQSFIDQYGITIKLDELIMDSHQIVFSNYFIAKFSFWNEWLKISEFLYKLAEDRSHPLSKEICKSTTYPGSVQRKVFMIERIASLLISIQRNWRVKSANPIQMNWSGLPTNRLIQEAIQSDALKQSYNITGFTEYLSCYNELRKKLFKIEVRE